jgi:hypothetical protein
MAIIDEVIKANDIQIILNKNDLTKLKQSSST